MHHHPDAVLYAFAPFVRRFVRPDGTAGERTFDSGEIIWLDDQMHIGENVGATDTDVLIVGLKEARPE